MPRKNYSKKTSKKQGKKTYKKRTYKKKSTKKYQSKGISGTIIPNRMFGKFRWKKDFEGSSDRGTETWNSTNFVNLLTYPKANAPASVLVMGSHCLSPSGEANLVDSNNTEIFVSEFLPLGLLNYGQFYKHAIVHASNFKIMIQPLTATVACYKYVLLPIPNPAYTGDVDNPTTAFKGHGASPYTSAVKDQLDNMVFSELAIQPRAKSGYIRTANSGPTYIKYKTMKTKTMLNVKDVKDCQDDFEMGLPYSRIDPINPVAVWNMTNNTRIPSNWSTNENQLQDYDSWIWYFRIFNQANATETNAGQLQFSITVDYFCELYDRIPMEMNSTQEDPVD